MTNNAVQPTGSDGSPLPKYCPKSVIVYPITGPAAKPAREPDVLTRAKSEAAFRPPMSVIAAQQVGCEASAKNFRQKKVHTMAAGESNARSATRNIPASRL